MAEKRLWQDQLGGDFSVRMHEVGEAMARHGLTRVEVRLAGGAQVCLERMPDGAFAQSTAGAGVDARATSASYAPPHGLATPPATPQANYASPDAAQHDTANPPPASAAAEAPAAPAGDLVRSPLVGTIFLAPEPGASPFIRPGDTVAKGETLMVVEAMKVMNKIEAPGAGTVSEILVSDAQAVEFGQPLLRLT